MTEDEMRFGAGAWVYCRQHLRPHTTGWCTVRADEKVPLDVSSQEAAYDECRRRGFEIFDSK